ncbi:MBL fold metallo-hydrolase [Paraglaciecola arctica]|uniref:Predicted Zn-dependent Hydrolase of the beta-lactamase fold protein n=1 Tax=Paraglaciecola arctica BSs20135 TaxID=493475 RepID=K6YSF8_9ALTE|nr:MBL fold metallo-hydrolase [Paraglaciecola arctica]GAC19628.1 predicted Zn-dependent Hydrolase of the beta-lactamase fold protein [Paraglaciecola arctica BSs20135]
MKVTQIRNATILIESVVEGNKQGILIDPMFAPMSAIASLKYATTTRRRNPLVELPSNMDELKTRVTCCLITHCQKGHFDHLDRAAIKWLRENNIPVYCSTQDSAFLRKKGLKVFTLEPSTENHFMNGSIKLIPCLHGEGWIGKMMPHGYGYHIQLPSEPSIYVTGDTILTNEVKNFITHSQPAIVVIPAGGATFDLGSEIIMGLSEAIQIGEFTKGLVIANHLEALDHCPVTRKSIHSEIEARGWEHRFFVPNDGESFNFDPLN